MTELRVVPESVEITPLPFDRAMKLRNGKRVAITADVGDIAKQLREINPDLKLFYNSQAAAYCVELHTTESNGSVTEHLVGAYDEIDARVLTRIRQVMHPDYDLEAEIAKSEAAADRAQEQKMAEALGDAGEKMGFALQKDLSRHEIGRTLKSRAFIPPPIVA